MSYFTMIRSKNHVFDLRLDIVLHARLHGIRDAARHFGTSRNTVRKWIRRFNHDGKTGLHDLSRAPDHCPHKTPPSPSSAVC